MLLLQHLRILCIGIWRLPPESTSIGMRQNNILGRLSTIDLKYIYMGYAIVFFIPQIGDLLVSDVRWSLRIRMVQCLK